MLSMLWIGLSLVCGSPGSFFGDSHVPAPVDTSPDLHLQPKNPHVSLSVQHTPMHLCSCVWGQSLSHVSSPRNRVSQYSPVRQHVPPHSTLLTQMQP